MSNQTLAHWNSLDAQAAEREVLPCCGSCAWARQLTAQRPFADVHELFTASDAVWATLPELDWQEAFDSHPRIGQHHAPSATVQSLKWSTDEQKAAISPDDALKLALAQANRQYEEKFGRIFIVCASGRSSETILAILRKRMNNDPAKELLEAAEQQRQITQLRLRRWLGTD
jgi:2-oxo-4-hydroxy-4-carboxy-5-ureidoimidazoline decarboxylase